MAGGQLHTVISHLRRLIGRENGCTLMDAQLLDDFVLRRDEASFEVLVWRHGSMVLELCRRVLRDEHEAEDAFQAVFLVFARKASSIGKRESVGSWLYKVAYRIALRARARRVAALARQEPAADLLARPGSDDLVWRDLRPLLDEEIDRLPEKYRAPFVLCYLQGHTNEEAAEQLGCPKGTVLSRLARGRERLRSRLARRGVDLSAGCFAAALSAGTASTEVPAVLIQSTVKAATQFAAGQALTGLVPAAVAALTEGVLHAMFLTKVKIAAVALALLTLAAVAPGARLLGHRARAERPAAAPTQAPVRERAVEPAGPVEPIEPFEPGEPAPAPQAREEQKEAEKATEIVGRVAEVGEGGKSFTLEVVARRRDDDKAKTVEVKIGDRTKVVYQGIGLGGAAPTKGYRAVVRREGSKDVAEQVIFHGMADPLRRGPDLTALVVAVSKDGKTITVEGPARGSRQEDAKRIDVKLTDRTMVVFHAVGPNAAQVADGYFAGVWFEEGSKDTARKIVFRGKEQVERRGGTAPDLVGRVVESTPDGKSFTLAIPPAARGEEPRKVAVKFDDKAPVVYNNVPAGGARLGAGLHARVWLKEGSKDTADRVTFTGTVRERDPQVFGKVAAVSKDSKTITLELRGRGRDEDTPKLDVKITDKTRLAFYGVGPGEAKPAEGLGAQVLLNEGSKDTAAGILFIKPGNGERRR
jgi:RNA polymerase sigma factor (sigma-70 family)